MNADHIDNYPLPSKAALQFQYLNKPLSSIPAPAAVIDRAIVRKNCNDMLATCKALGLGFRAHVKSHKTLEIAKMQVGETGPANFIVSTLVEAENLVPFLLECEVQGREYSILYGIPVPLSAVPRLCRLAKLLRPGSVNILVDSKEVYKKFLTLAYSHTSDNTLVSSFGIFIKIDTGYGRAGVKIGTEEFYDLGTEVWLDNFKGLYSHLGSSYSGSNTSDAMKGLLQELRVLQTAASSFDPSRMKNKLTLTVGATPTATAAQNLLEGKDTDDLRATLQSLTAKFNVELHAGVYTLLDLQQLATHARPTGPNPYSSIALQILVEVTSLYTRSKPEALISAGTLALGREPCKSYPGWGIVNHGDAEHYDPDGDRTGWIIERISQEHGILAWQGEIEKFRELDIGSNVLVWPNHACVAAAGFGWFLVVDSEGDGGDLGGRRVVDVWVRWRGW